MAITMTAGRRDHYVMLTITGPDTITSIRRVDANGNADVRTLSGFFPRAGDFQLADYESAITGPVVYTAVSAAGVLATARVTMTTTQPWLTVPAYPTKSLELAQVSDYDSDRQSFTKVNLVIDRVDPVLNLGALALRAGRLEILALTHRQARDIEALADGANILLLRQADHAGLDMYFAVLRSSVRADSDGLFWMVTLSYQQVARPTIDRNPDGVWTYADLRAAYASYGAVVGSFPDYQALQVNDPYLPGEVR